MKLFFILGVILAFLLTLSAVFAAEPPSLQPPLRFQGAVTINGEPAQTGLSVVAKIDDNLVEAGTTANGGYGYSGNFVIPDPYGNRAGKTISFFIEGHNTGETAIYSAEAGYIILNLDLQGSLFCGDSQCASSESCSSCAADCGGCGGGGGGGGGGSGGGMGGSYSDETNDTEENTTSGCTPNWQCTDWLDCVSGTQKRVCTDSNRCGISEGKPAEERTCVVVAPIKINSPAEQKSSEGNADGLNPEKKGLGSITGAVIGSGVSFWWLGLIIVIIVAVIIIIFMAGNVKLSELFRKKRR